MPRIGSAPSGENSSLAGTEKVPVSGSQFALISTIAEYIRTLTQTLTNKTVNLSNNTVTGTTAQFNTALSDGDFATLAGSETLTNKVLTAPTMTDFTNAQHDHGDADDGGAVAYSSLTGALTQAAGVYNPTRSAEANLDSNVTMTEAQYLRLGATVTVSGRFTADPTAAGAASFEITLPVASNLGAAEDVAGVAFCGSIAGQGAEIIGVAANDTAKVQWIAVDTTSQTWSYTFSYQVI